ncbi:hypothetical protein EVAR_37327_1 [Eumeta japonica]|uniref:Uncharacterized protein n=1 Tax=Eumeta variegata TaxID=151549 RepID=A0A4C1WZV7_EUMVA|nr:hypothetical protein EVAR_37327_1 [Eumeta japonica]
MRNGLCRGPLMKYEMRGAAPTAVCAGSHATFFALSIPESRVARCVHVRAPTWSKEINHVAQLYHYLSIHDDRLRVGPPPTGDEMPGATRERIPNCSDDDTAGIRHTRNPKVSLRYDNAVLRKTDGGDARRGAALRINSAGLRIN